MLKSKNLEMMAVESLLVCLSHTSYLDTILNIPPQLFYLPIHLALIGNI